jgi:hypothetical protein
LHPTQHNGAIRIKKQLKKNNQALSFYTNNDDMSIGAVYANGAQDISDSGVICRDAHALHPTQHNGAIQVRPYQD